MAIRIFHNNRDATGTHNFTSVAKAKKWVVENYAGGGVSAGSWKKQTATYQEGRCESHFGGPANAWEIRKDISDE